MTLEQRQIILSLLYSLSHTATMVKVNSIWLTLEPVLHHTGLKGYKEPQSVKEARELAIRLRYKVKNMNRNK